MARRPAKLERPPAANIIHECPHCGKHSYLDLGPAQAFDRDRADRDTYGEEPTEKLSGFGRFGEALADGGAVPSDADLGRKSTQTPPDWRNPDQYQGETPEVKDKQEASRRAGLNPPATPPPQTTAKLARGGFARGPAHFDVGGAAEGDSDENPDGNWEADAVLDDKDRRASAYQDAGASRRDGLGKVDGVHTSPDECEHLAAGGPCHHFAPGKRRAREDGGDGHVRNFANGGFANYLTQQRAAGAGRYRKTGRKGKGEE